MAVLLKISGCFRPSVNSHMQGSLSGTKVVSNECYGANQRGKVAIVRVYITAKIRRIPITVEYGTMRRHELFPPSQESFALTSVLAL